MVVLLFAAPGTSARVLLEALTPAFESATPQPLAFAIEDPAHGLAAGGAAEARPVADRLQGGLMATRSDAAGRRQNNFCCVTTRRRRCRLLCGLRRRACTLTARTLRLGVLRFDRGIEASEGLPPRRLPEAEQSSAFGILAVTLVPAPRLISAAATFTQTEPRPRSSGSGTGRALWLTMTTAHGRCFLPRDSPRRAR